MASPMTSLLGSFIKNQDSGVTLSVDLSDPPQGLVALHNFSLSISILGVPVPIFKPQEDTLPAFTEHSMIGSLDSRDTIGDPAP